MRTKLKGLFTLLIALAVQWSFAQEHKVTGKVTDASSGEPLPGVNIVIEGTQKGTVTDFDGNYSITASPDDVLVFSYVGYNDVKEKVGNRNVINVAMQAGTKLAPVVVDISGRKQDIKTLSYAVQPVKSEQLEISDISNVGSSIAGKVAGAQVWEQAGSKLGYAPKVRIRGRIALTSDSNPLYVVDGIPVTDPSVIDPDNIESVEVLKGPNATAIYGQRGINGVIRITTKKAKTGAFAISVNSKITFENVAYLPKYQNDYGQGYEAENEWSTYPGWGINGWDAPEFSNYPYIFSAYADESWGPKFDGREYLPWYSWWPDSPYYGKPAKWEAQPENIKNFYQRGVYLKNNVSIASGGKNYKANISFSNLDQKGIIPFSTYKRYFVNSNFEYNISKSVKAGLNLSYSQFKRHGDFDDNYGNQTSGSFNAWFARDLDMAIQKELIDLKTPEGYYASWNWWNPLVYAYYGTFLGKEDYKKPVFWFNHYTWLRDYDRNGNGTSLIANLWVQFEISKNFSTKFSVTRNQSFNNQDYKLPYQIEYSSGHNLYVHWVNSMGLYNGQFNEDNYNAFLFYNNDLTDNLSMDLMLGANARVLHSSSRTAWMNPEDLLNGLIVPDIYRFENTKRPVPIIKGIAQKKTYSLFGKATFGYADMLFIEATARQDWSSALFPERNGYFYPSLGLSFNFSNMESYKDSKISKYINKGKFRLGWAQVGSDIAAHLIYPSYRFLGQVPYNSNALLLTPSYFVDPNLVPAINSSFETGFDLNFLNDKAFLNFTYYYEKRKNEIVTISVPAVTGYTGYLTNAGSSHRSGIEVTLGGTLYQNKSKDFSWDIAVNFSQNKTIVDEVPTGKEMLAPGGRWTGGDQWGRVLLVHAEGKEWGQLKAYDIKRDKDGNPYLYSNGLYQPTDSMVYFGSVLPKYVGGITNTLSYKNFKLTAHFTFQKGGKFYSGSEVWGYYSGLYEETGMGGNREDGMEVKGVDSNGNPVTVNVQTLYGDEGTYGVNYWKQFHNNNIGGPFIHDASYFKLRELSLSYTLPKKVLGKYLKGASVAIIGTNVWLIAVAKDNYHRWDPSELSHTYGEDAQLPGTRRIGMNLKLTF